MSQGSPIVLYGPSGQQVTIASTNQYSMVVNVIDMTPEAARAQIEIAHKTHLAPVKWAVGGMMGLAGVISVLGVFLAYKTKWDIYVVIVLILALGGVAAPFVIAASKKAFAKSGG